MSPGQAISNKPHSTEPLMDNYPNMRYCMVNNTLAALEQLNSEIYNNYEFSASEIEKIEMLTEQCRLFLSQYESVQTQEEE
jgi:hypothetical protein